MSKVHSHYENLKVTRDAPVEVIRAAYRVLAQKYHPDRKLDNVDAERIMKVLNAAYETLSDPAMRREHDQWIAAAEAGGSTARIIEPVANPSKTPSDKMNKSPKEKHWSERDLDARDPSPKHWSERDLDAEEPSPKGKHWSEKDLR